MVAKLLGIGMLLLTAASTARAAAPAITSVGGYSDGFTVNNGRFHGQIIVPSGGTNKYKNFLASDSYGPPASSPYYWDIIGNNFGTVQGTLDFGVTPNPFTSVIVVSWTATRIRVKVVAYNLFVSSPISLKVITSAGVSSVPFHDNVAGTIAGRGAGQCTWYAAQTRITQGLSIPPTPWGTNGSIPNTGGQDNGYRPKQWDCVIYPIHIAIITSAPVQTTNPDGSMKWTFTVSEYNAGWTESFSSSTRSYSVSKPNTRGQRTVLSGIGTNLGLNTYAKGFFR